MDRELNMADKLNTGSHSRSAIRSRLTAAILLFSVLPLLLAARLCHLQVIEHDDFAELASSQRLQRMPIPARPGDILDCRGRLLATSVRSPSLYVVPREIDDIHDYSQKLADALQIESDWIEHRISSRKDRWFLWIKRLLTEEQVTRVRELKLPAHTWGLNREYQRLYPEGSLAFHLLGLRDIDGIGRGGIESICHDKLEGMEGELAAFKDARGRIIDHIPDFMQPATPGETVTLTIDSIIQLIVEQQLDEAVVQHQPHGACAIVMNPGNSEVLAMASRPGWNRNSHSSVPSDAWRNLAVSAVFEPGSTVKPLVVAWAMQQGVLQADEKIDCEYGRYRMGSRLLHDHHGYGELSISDILVHSSNIGMAKIGERLGNVKLYQGIESFGLGQITGISLVGELPGLLRPVDKWDIYSTGSIPMGQEFAITPLQLISAHCVLASDGRWRQPKLIKSISDENIVDSPAKVQFFTSQVTVPVVDPLIAQEIVRGPMRDVVERGTGRRSRIDGYDVFGKTGTSQKYDAELKAYSNTRSVCSFVGGLPAQNPEVLVLVMLDEPQSPSPSGGKTAAPIAREILKRIIDYRHLPPTSETH
ncbi:peptidoglycan D,D-transpeptidase FtsI family protein [Calycomorphotria hydatis]|uniref:Peptidoglycan D,D-transpeptidase FtsI n=1 Tax=Calycomorphotria hydatis TaxID=2528027 RepID=A0A517T9E5_9PLAN|nr:penicillin-binding protein 2 [Calycomorphotria hydatis]QDT64993.1 Peptidoglycan D,D-transpeptidase FtsI [Calycomorphotria hydatis]